MKISEDLKYSDYVCIKEKQSEIDKDKTLFIEKGLYCPQCRIFLPNITHGKSQSCYSCKLRMWRFGNCLHCVKKIFNN